MPEDNPSDEGQLVWMMGERGIFSGVWPDEDIDEYIADGNRFESCHECGVMMTENAASELGAYCPKCRKAES
jgi:hypothetical protein